jgi:hypothetical protein
MKSTEESAPMNPSLTKSAFASSKGDLGVSFLLLSLLFFGLISEFFPNLAKFNLFFRGFRAYS